MAPAPATKKLTVVVKPAKPFVFERGGATIGYSVELWRRVAQEGFMRRQTSSRRAALRFEASLGRCSR